MQSGLQDALGTGSICSLCGGGCGEFYSLTFRRSSRLPVSLFLWPQTVLTCVSIITCPPTLTLLPSHFTYQDLVITLEPSGQCRIISASQDLCS